MVSWIKIKSHEQIRYRNLLLHGAHSFSPFGCALYLYAFYPTEPRKALKLISIGRTLTARWFLLRLRGEPLKNSRIPILFNTPPELKKIQIFGCSDMHNGSAQFNEKAWLNIENLLQVEGNYIIFAGDQCEYATHSSKSDVYEQRLRPAEQKRWWIKHLEPYKDKIICVIDGNHEFNRASKDADDFPLYDIALALGIEDVYRSEGAIVDIGVGDGGHGKGKQIHYVGRIQHKAQALKNYSSSDGWEGIDFFMYGHDHRPSDVPRAKMVYDTKNKTITQKNIENIDCGSFLTFGGYGERNGYRVASSKKYSLILDGKKKDIETRGFYL